MNSSALEWKLLLSPLQEAERRQRPQATWVLLLGCCCPLRDALV